MRGLSHLPQPSLHSLKGRGGFCRASGLFKCCYCQSLSTRGSRQAARVHSLPTPLSHLPLTAGTGDAGAHPTSGRMVGEQHLAFRDHLPLNRALRSKGHPVHLGRAEHPPAAHLPVSDVACCRPGWESHSYGQQGSQQMPEASKTPTTEGLRRPGSCLRVASVPHPEEQTG